MTDEPLEPAYVGRDRPGEVADRPPPPGQATLTLAALAIGLVLVSIQLWLLTVALELVLAGHGARVWQLALASGAIFLGGLWVTWLIRRRPRIGRPPLP